MSIRLFVDSDLTSGAHVALSREQSHYLSNVMRQKEGATVHVFNGRDGEWQAIIDTVSKRDVTLKAEVQAQSQETEPDLWLAFAPIKKARLDFIAQKATELGVSRMVPVMTRRTIVDRVKTDRMVANAIEAAEQCERLTVPTIGEVAKLEQLLNTWPQDRYLMFCDEDLSGKPAHTALSEVATGSIRKIV